MSEPKRIRVVSKVAEILRLFPGAEPLSLTEIARGMDANTSSIYHIVQTLVDEGFLSQDVSTRKYSLGPTLLTLVPPHSQTAALVAAAEGPLYECSQATGFDVWLGLLELDRVYYIARVAGDSPLKVHMPLLQLQPAHAVSPGRVMLSGLSSEKARATLSLHTLRKMTPDTCTDVERVLTEVDKAREQGYAEVDGEHIVGASDMAVPVFGLNGVMIAAISIGAPSHVFGHERRLEVLPHLQTAAARTRERLLKSQPPPEHNSDDVLTGPSVMNAAS
ncbi:MAG: IclR family transcriptional regulator [Dehalococcoidia bacterium]